MSRERPWLKPNDESLSLKRNFLQGQPASSGTRQAIFVYVIGMALLVLGGVYAVWRIDLLSNYLAANRAYVLERDTRWERHIQGQAEVTREILRRLPRK
jgi:hypothetical protein